MDLLLEMAPMMTGNGALVIGAALFFNKKVDTLKGELSGMNSRISKIEGYIKGKAE